MTDTNEFFDKMNGANSANPELMEQPEAYSPEPEAYSSQPEMYSAQPEAYSPQPEMYNVQPEANSPQPQFYNIPQGEMPQEKKKKVRAKKNKKPVTMGKVITTCIACVICTVLINSAILYGVLEYGDFTKNSSGNTPQIQSTLSTTKNNEKDSVGTPSTGSDGEYTVKEIAELVTPSVVAITNTSIVEQNYNPFYGGGTYQVQGAGSGIIIGQNDTELLIVTNNHVVDGSVSLSIKFCNNTSIDTAYVKGTSSSNDIAVVGISLDDIDEDTLSQIKIATLGSSDQLSVGDGVVAIGNALGYGQSVTVGYVSAMQRTITLNNSDIKVIQTDAAINGGNSGGALINMKGEVIGINVAKSSTTSTSSASVEGMGYAIPISDATDIITKLMNQEVRQQYSDEERGYLGVGVITVDSATSETYGMPAGAYVRNIVEDSPAEKAGIVAGTVIVKVEDMSISTKDDLVEELSYYTAGDEVTITAYVPDGREYTEHTFTITLTKSSVFDE